MLNVKIISDQGEQWEITTNSVTLPGVEGRFQILKNHLPVIELLERGVILTNGNTKILKNNMKLNFEKETKFYIEDGVVKNYDNNIIVIGSIKPL